MYKSIKELKQNQIKSIQQTKMKFLVLATFAAFCTASSLYQGRNIAVNDDGTISISTQNGKQVVITGTNGQRSIQIGVIGPTIPMQVVQIDDQGLLTSGNQRSLINSIIGQGWGIGAGSTHGQAAVLAAILSQYQGAVDQALFQQLLNQVSQAVNNGQINGQVYALLEELEQIEEVMNALGGQGQVQVVWGQQGLTGLQNGIYGQGNGIAQTIVPVVSTSGRVIPVEIQSRSLRVGQQQIPMGQDILSAIANNQWATSRNVVNPLLARMLAVQQQQQQLAGVVSVLGNQIVSRANVPLVQGGFRGVILGNLQQQQLEQQIQQQMQQQMQQQLQQQLQQQMQQQVQQQLQQQMQQQIMQQQLQQELQQVSQQELQQGLEQQLQQQQQQQALLSILTQTTNGRGQTVRGLTGLLNQPFTQGWSRINRINRNNIGVPQIVY